MYKNPVGRWHLCYWLLPKNISEWCWQGSLFQ